MYILCPVQFECDMSETGVHCTFMQHKHLCHFWLSYLLDPDVRLRVLHLDTCHTLQLFSISSMCTLFA